MLYFSTPETLFATERDTFIGLLPGVRDGGVEAVHDARVSSRRLRELVPLLTSRYSPRELERLELTFKEMTRTLGRARDWDVMAELLGSIETRMPQLIRATGVLHAELRSRRERVMRKALKRLETLELDEVMTAIAGNHPRRRLAFWKPKPWRETLRQQIAERAAGVRHAIEHSSGVYFPNRLHSGRVSLKKLRYSVEIATATGVYDGRQVLGSLKKAQELLGKVHDREVLAQFAHQEDDAAAALVPVLDMQRRELHARYLRRRQELVDIAAALAMAPRRMTSRPLLIAGAALPVALLAASLRSR